jgi:O-methyltransferase
MVVFDDYGFPARPGIAQCVDEQRKQADRLVLHDINGHGLVVKC